jgi:hypothetical protein
VVLNLKGSILWIFYKIQGYWDPSQLILQWIEINNWQLIKENSLMIRACMGKLNYLTITRLDISFAVSDVSQFLETPIVPH